jgi:hypothetical protein
MRVGGGDSDGKREVFCLTKLSGATINTVSDRLMKHEYDTLKQLQWQEEIQVLVQKPVPNFYYLTKIPLGPA